MSKIKPKAKLYRTGNTVTYIVADSRGRPVYENSGDMKLWGEMTEEIVKVVEAVRIAEWAGLELSEWWWLPGGSAERTAKETLLIE